MPETPRSHNLSLPDTKQKGDKENQKILRPRLQSCSTELSILPLLPRLGCCSPHFAGNGSRTNLVTCQSYRALRRNRTFELPSLGVEPILIRYVIVLLLNVESLKKWWEMKEPLGSRGLAYCVTVAFFNPFWGQESGLPGVLLLWLVPKESRNKYLGVVES